MRIGRRAQSATVLVGLLGSVACGPSSTQIEREIVPVEATTVVLISIDTLRADHLGSYGRPNAGTPTIDSLALGGTTFRRAQTTAPLTLPAHTSMLTGRSLAGHGVFNNLTFALPEVVPTLAERLRSAGYVTGAFVSAPVLARRYGLDRGFDVYDDRIVPTAGSRMSPSHAERSGAETVRVASSFLSDAGTRAAFVFVHLYEPHRPYSPPPDIAARVGGDRYQGEIALADSAVAALVESLKRTGRERNTLLILTADHGEGLGEHGEATHGMYLYAGTLNVPLIVHAPQLGVKAGFSDETVSVADIAPTVLDLLKLAPLADADGLSLARLVRGEVDTLSRAGVVAESHIPRLEFGWSGLRAWVNGDTKLIQAPRPELYVIGSDPQEQHDLASEQRAVVKLQLEQLASAVQTAARHSPGGAEQSVSAEQQEVLRSLGYVASGGRSGPGDLVDPKLVDPKDRAKFAVLFDKAVLATQAGQLTEALDTFSKLRAIEADNPALLFELGQAQIRAGQLQQAKETYQRLVKIRPDQGVAWFRYAQLLDNSHDWGPAEAAYRRAVQVDPNNMDARKALGSLLSEQKRFGEAISELEQASKLDPNDV
ncbi:MAG: sulfatase-like hydrolase/transferase, partial [Acidobacteriota bacterium]